MDTDFRRARTPERKQQRAEDLLDAARRLARDEGARAVTLTEIASTAGVHVSAVRRYFESREEIFLRLAGQGWREWADAVGERLNARTDPGGLARTLAETLDERPLFCDLLAHTPLSLERAVSADVVRTYKLSALAAAHDLAETMGAAVPELGAEAAGELVAMAMALAQSLWQIANPPETLTKLYREDPRLAHARVDFVPRMTRLLLASILGLIAAQDR